MTPEHAQRVYADLLEKLRVAVRGSRNNCLNSVTFFAARAFAGNLLDKDEKAVKCEIFEAANKAWDGDVPDTDLNTATSAWDKGVAQPIARLDPETEASEALEYVETILADEGKVTLPEEFIRRASQLDKLHFEIRRKDMIRKLNMRPKAFDELINLHQVSSAETDEILQGKPVSFEDLEPWDQDVDGAVLLNVITTQIQKYVVTPGDSASALALWVLFTYVWKQFNFYPYVVAWSPSRGCGKTTLRDALALLSYKSLPTDNCTAAFVFRVLEMHQPTLFIDEADNWFKDDERRSILNAGSKRGGGVGRTVGEDHDPRSFSTIGPKFIGMIKPPPATILDRSIVIHMMPRLPSEPITDWPEVEPPEFLQLRRQSLRWANDNGLDLSVTRLKRPEGIGDRHWDLWAPLAAIATRCGGQWPDLAVKLCRNTSQVRESERDENVEFLGDVRAILGGAESITSAKLAEELNKMDDRPYHDENGLKGITPNRVTSWLGTFGVGNRQRGKKNRQHRFLREDLEPIFARYPETQERAEQLNLALSDDEAKF